MFALTTISGEQVYNLVVTDHQYAFDNRSYMTHDLRAKSAEQKSQVIRETSTNSTVHKATMKDSLLSSNVSCLKSSHEQYQSHVHI